MKSGDPCPCGGRLRVISSRRECEWQKQYLACTKCDRRETARVHESAVFRRNSEAQSNGV